MVHSNGREVALSFWKRFSDEHLAQGGTEEELALLDSQVVLTDLVMRFQEMVAQFGRTPIGAALASLGLLPGAIEELGLISHRRGLGADDREFIFGTKSGNDITIVAIPAALRLQASFEELTKGMITSAVARRLITPTNFPHESTNEPAPLTLFYLVNFGVPLTSAEVEQKAAQLGRQVPDKAVYFFTYAKTDEFPREPVVSLGPVGTGEQGEPVVLVSYSDHMSGWIEAEAIPQQWPAHVFFLLV